MQTPGGTDEAPRPACLRRRSPPPRRKPPRQSILFVGNSYTFGRVDPVMSYNAASVDDMTRPRPDLPDPNFTETAGTRAWEPHPWGGVPGIFKQLADQAGVDVRRFAVDAQCRLAARALPQHGQCRLGPARQHRQAEVGRRRAAGAERCRAAAGTRRERELPPIRAYADKIEKYIHVGAAESYRERAMYTAIYGSVANCVAAGGTESSCDNNTLRTIPANPNANPKAKVYLTQTWARPDMVFPHLSTVADANYPTVPDGRPIVDTPNPAFPNGFPDTLYYEAEGLAGMTADLRAAFAAKARREPELRRRHPGRRCVPARDRRSHRQGRRLLQQRGHVRGLRAERQDQPLVGRLPAREQARLVSQRAGHLRHADGHQPGIVRREREGRGRPRHQSGRRRPIAARGGRPARGFRYADRLDSLPAPQPGRPGQGVEWPARAGVPSRQVTDNRHAQPHRAAASGRALIVLAARRLAGTCARCAPARGPDGRAGSAPSGPPQALLWVGNSFFYYNNSMHGHVALLARGDKSITHRGVSVTISGSGIDWHDVASYLGPDRIGKYSFVGDNEIRFNPPGPAVRRGDDDGLQPVPDPPAARAGLPRVREEARGDDPRERRPPDPVHVVGVQGQAGDDRPARRAVHEGRQGERRAGGARPGLRSRSRSRASPTSSSTCRTSATPASRARTWRRARCMPRSSASRRLATPTPPGCPPTSPCTCSRWRGRRCVATAGPDARPPPRRGPGAPTDLGRMLGSSTR